jgi:hypothetical protein
MEPNRMQRLPGLMRRSDRIGQAGGVGSKAIAGAILNTAYRSPGGVPDQHATAADRAHSRGAESLELVTVAGSLLESSKELLQLSQVQIRGFIARREMTTEDLARQTAARRAN